MYIRLIIAAIVAIFVIILSYIVIKKRFFNQQYEHSGKKHREIQEIRKEIDKLQVEIDEALKSQKAGLTIKSEYGIKTAPASTITGFSDYKSALEELDTTSVCDLVEVDSKDFVIYEWERRNTQNEAWEEAIKFTQSLEKIDKTLESDDKQKINEAIIDLMELCFKYPEDCELLYRIGMAHVKMSKDESEEIIKNHIEKAIKVLETALKLNAKHAEANKWYAISLGLRCQYASMSQKMRDGILIKKHCELACAVKPNDAVVYHILGRFDYEIASLSWWERAAGNAILGDYMNASFKDALTKFEEAERYSRLQPFSKKEKKENKTMIAKTLIKLNRNAESVRWLREAKKIGDDTELDKEVNTLLQKYQ